jgi:hypothetical protein
MLIYQGKYQRQSTLDCRYLALFCDNLKPVNVAPKLFFLTLFWEFVMFFQLSTSLHYYIAKQIVYVRKNKTSR